MDLLQKDFKFIDLFSGLGGFHFAMKKISENSECVFASEINENAIKLYKLNHAVNSENDIKKISFQDIPNFDVLCAGFPCQPFSKAGLQNGFADPRGTLFFEIIKILRNKIENNQKPKLLVLENVRNLKTHDKGNTWNVIKKSLRALGYNTIDEPLIVSPVDFGIPQLRERTIILAIDDQIYSKKLEFNLKKNHKDFPSIDSILDHSLKTEGSGYEISKYELSVLEAWDYFIKHVDLKTIGFPIWSDEFNKNYDISDLPEWKQQFITKNRDLYKRNKKMIDYWREQYKVDNFVKTHRKFEWQAGKNIESVFQGIIQFRTSGVRVKKPTQSPALVAMVHTPIVGKFKRYITPEEALKLQSFPDDFNYKEVGKDIYRLLGNAVNVEVIYNVTKQFLSYINNNNLKEINNENSKREY